MKKQIDVRLIIHPDCKLTVIDDYSYLDWFGPTGQLQVSIDNFVSVEFLTYKGETAKKSVKFECFESGNTQRLTDSQFPLFKDGMYNYYKFMIPKLQYLFVEYDDPKNKNIYYTGLKDAGQLYSGIHIAKQQFYYKGHLYQYNDTSDIEFDTPLCIEDALSKYSQNIIDNSTIIDYKDLQNILEADLLGDQVLYCKKNTFTICNLIKCFVSLQKQVIKNELSYSCMRTEDVSKQRDFLLSTIYVLDYLKDINNFAEAQRIIDSVTECTTLCSNISNDCNCGCNG